MIPHILFKFASRSRPEKFFATLNNILSKLPKEASYLNYSILCSVDEDDPTAITEDFRQRAGSIGVEHPITIVWGKSKNKIDAVNRDIEKAGRWDILVNVSDDMEFVVDGFDNHIRVAFLIAENTGEVGHCITKFNFDQFLHFNDGNQKGNVSTMSIMGWDYYRRRNYIYNPEYISVWCDVEATDEACMLGRYKYMGDDLVIFKHNHPAWGLAEYDEQYRASENLDVWGKDLQTLINRKRNKYGITDCAHAFKYPDYHIQNWITELNNARQNKGMPPIEFK